MGYLREDLCKLFFSPNYHSFRSVTSAQVKRMRLSRSLSQYVSKVWFQWFSISIFSPVGDHRLIYDPGYNHKFGPIQVDH